MGASAHSSLTTVSIHIHVHELLGRRLRVLRGQLHVLPRRMCVFSTHMSLTKANYTTTPNFAGVRELHSLHVLKRKEAGY